MELQNLIGAGLAVGLSGIGVAIGQGMLAKSSMEVIGSRKELSSFFLTMTILGIALVESAVIYGLIIALNVMGKDGISWIASIGAGLAIGLTGLGAGYGEGKLVSGTLKAMESNPDMRGKLMTFMILFVALIESAAIYGLIVAFRILGSEGALISAANPSQAFLGMGFSIGLAGMGVAIGMGFLSERTLKVMAKREDLSGVLLTITILGIALVESAAIYGFVIALRLEATNLPLYISTGAGLAIGLTGLGAGLGEGIAIRGAIYSLARNPEIRGRIITFMVLFIALIEVVAIYGFVVVFPLLNKEIDSIKYLAAGIGIGFAGIGVGSGIGLLTEESLKTMGKNPKMINFLLTISILGVALVESAVIYALVVSLQIINSDTVKDSSALAMGFASGLAGLGAGIGEGLLIRGAIKGINIHPEFRSRILAFMILFVALVEVVAIYGLIIFFQVQGK